MLFCVREIRSHPNLTQSESHVLGRLLKMNKILHNPISISLRRRYIVDYTAFQTAADRPVIGTYYNNRDRNPIPKKTRFRKTITNTKSMHTFFQRLSKALMRSKRVANVVALTSKLPTTEFTKTSVLLETQIENLEIDARLKKEVHLNIHLNF
ncbi:hypothetical protein J6590_068480 [Homalodisca vitripennis]|nr:hypothetical protein J6590_068480 [Homalodisca vitripennis]